MTAGELRLNNAQTEDISSVLIGAPYADPNDNDSGVIYVVRTTVTPDPYGNTLLIDLGDPIPTIVGEGPYEYAGWAVAGGGDVDGAGTDDAERGADGKCDERKTADGVRSFERHGSQAVKRSIRIGSATESRTASRRCRPRRSSPSPRS